MSARPTLPAPGSILVVGYGNELRGDDGLGPCIARTVESWGLAGVQALALHQLVPEVALQLAQAECAIFVDACAGGSAQEQIAAPVLSRLQASQAAGTITHTGDPCGMLALTHALYGHAPRAWLVCIPTTTFALDTQLSPAATRQMYVALRRLRAMLAMLPRLMRARTRCGRPAVCRR